MNKTVVYSRSFAIIKL